MRIHLVFFPLSLSSREESLPFRWGREKPTNKNCAICWPPNENRKNQTPHHPKKKDKNKINVMEMTVDTHTQLVAVIECWWTFFCIDISTCSTTADGTRRMSIWRDNIGTPCGNANDVVPEKETKISKLIGVCADVTDESVGGCVSSPSFVTQDNMNR